MVGADRSSPLDRACAFDPTRTWPTSLMLRAHRASAGCWRAAAEGTDASDPDDVAEETRLQATDSAGADYYHKVVDCQWACPAHTPVPEYIRLIGQGRY